MKAKKILAGACASLMLAMTTAPVVGAADAVKVTVGNATAKAGENFSVTIDLADIPAAGINACDFGVKYDSSALTITNVTAGALAKDETTLEGVSALETNIEAGLVSIIYGLGTTEAANYMKDGGTFVTLEGKVSNTAKAGKYDLTIVAVDRLADPSGSASNTDIIFGNLAADNTTCTVYTPSITNGSVTVGDAAVTTTEGGKVTTTTTTRVTTPTLPSMSVGEVSKLGDVDLNDAVESADLIMLSKYLVNANTYPLKDSTAVANADINQDKSINGLDSGKLVEFLLGAIETL